MRFGEFLLMRGRVSEDDLDEARHMQLVNNHLIGVLAMDHGLLKLGELEQILHHQAAIAPRPRFGEVAVGLGYLSPQQLEVLVAVQRENRLRIGDVLVLRSTLTEEELLAELRAYRDYMARKEVA